MTDNAGTTWNPIFDSQPTYSIGSVDIDPSNFLFTRTYGQAPANTTLTVTYTVGNGISDNVVSGTIINIKNIYL